MSLETKSWRPTLRLFAKQETEFKDPDGKNASIRWTFDCEKMPFFLKRVQCTMSGFGLKSVGFSADFTFINASRKALAEAWERLWYERVKSKQIELPFPVLSSNGFAAGPSMEMAREWSRGELIERALVLHCWHEMSGWKSLLAKQPEVWLFKKYLARDGWSLKLFQLGETEKGSSLAGLAQHETKGSVFDSVYAPPNSCSVRSLLISLLRMITQPTDSLILLPA